MESQSFIVSQIEQLQSRFIGTGHEDTSRDEWQRTIHNDTTHAILANESLALYVATAESVSTARLKYRLKSRIAHLPSMLDVKQQQQ
ncbi:hypothetical protein MP228_002012 [Amoeboaphelidium protococcarum]|nr:hypothetical protein MP228_002012 [Amoeboaphelidium protococcarum]